MHAVGVNDIAVRARASKLSMYRYFPSKAELVEAMLSEHSDRIHAWLESKTADAAPGPDRLLSVFDLLMRWFAQPGYHGCTVVNTVTDTEPTRPSPRSRGATFPLSRPADHAREPGRPRGCSGAGSATACSSRGPASSIDGGAEAGLDARRAAEALINGYVEAAALT